MRLARALVSVAAWTIPRFAPPRYREEWLADLNGARQLGLSEYSVVGGAAMTALTIDRADPGVTGLPKARLVPQLERPCAVDDRSDCRSGCAVDRAFAPPAADRTHPSEARSVIHRLRSLTALVTG